MKPTILIIDDSPIVLGVTRSVLEGAGYRVLTHGRAMGSVSLILEQKPHLVLLDVNMPNLKGNTIARMSARTAHSAGTVVLLHSTLPDAELQSLVVESGANGYIRKTSNNIGFLRQVRRWIGDGPSGTMVAVSPSSTSGMASTSGMSGVTASGGEPSSHASSHRRQVQDTTILLVNRDMSKLSSMRQLVQELGFRSDFALSTKQALSRLASASPPASVLVSAELPEGGLEQLYTGAVAADRRWAERFVVTWEGTYSPDLPAGFRGPVLQSPFHRQALERALASAMPKAMNRTAESD